MTDFWADRIKLNPAMEVHKDDQETISGSTQGTCERQYDAGDSASYVDISNNFKTKTLADPPADRQF